MAAARPPIAAWRPHFETALRVAAPALNLLLYVGDKLSRAVERDDPGYVPPRRRTPIA